MRKKGLIQIQPQSSMWELWTELAQQYDLTYEAIEFFMPQVFNDNEFERIIRGWYRDSGKVRSIHGAFIDINPASGDPMFREISERRCHESCRLAKDLGASNVVFHSSCFPFLRGFYLNSWASRCASFYTELAETYDVNICIENSQDVDTTPISELMKRISDKRVSVCLDIGHVNYSDTPLEEWFDKLGERITYLHLSDNMGGFDDHIPLGAGTVDWQLADNLWRQLNRDTPITLEIGKISDVKTSLSFLGEHGFFGIKEG